jgi:hypothetical protein
VDTGRPSPRPAGGRGGTIRTDLERAAPWFLLWSAGVSGARAGAADTTGTDPDATPDRRPGSAGRSKPTASDRVRCPPIRRWDSVARASVREQRTRDLHNSDRSRHGDCVGARVPANEAAGRRAPGNWTGADRNAGGRQTTLTHSVYPSGRDEFRVRPLDGDTLTQRAACLRLQDVAAANAEPAALAMPNSLEGLSMYARPRHRRTSVATAWLAGAPTPCYTGFVFLTAELPAFRIRSEFLDSPALRRRAFRSSLPSDSDCIDTMQECP